MPNEKTAVIYARVSTVRQAEEELPVESQVEQCQRKAEELGARVLKVFRDDGISGRSDSRPAFQDSINYCDLFEPDFFICWSSSRFARNKVDAGFYKRRLQKANVQLTYVSMQVDHSTNEGWLLDGVMELFDELYSRQVSADTMRSMLKNARSGYWNGGRAPLGFEAVPDEQDPKRKRLRPVDHEADLVRQVFRMRVDGLGARAIAMKLNETGRLHRGRKWNKTAISDLLRNQAAIGNIVFGKKDRATGRRRPRDQWIVVPSHQPIIPQDLWDTVQGMMDEETTTGGSPLSTFFFTGILQCGRCGSSMQIETAKGRSRRYEYYNCRRQQRSGDCENRRLPARELDEWLVDKISSEVLTAENLASVVEELNEACGTWATEHRKRRAAVLGRIQEVEGRNKKLYEVLELMGKDAPNLGDLTKRLRDNNAEIRSLEEQLSAIESEKPPEPLVTETDVAELAEMLVDIIKTTKNPKKVRHFFGSFVDAIRVYDDRLEIEYKPAALVSGAVHSEVSWLPGPAALGTNSRRNEWYLPSRILSLDLPEKFARRAA